MGFAFLPGKKHADLVKKIVLIVKREGGKRRILGIF